MFLPESQNLYLSFISQENRSSSNAQMHTQILRVLYNYITFSCFNQNLNLYFSFISQENRSSSNTQMHTQIHTQILRTLNSRFALEHRYNINRRHSLNQIKADMLVVLRDMSAFRNVRSEFFQYWKTILK